MRINLTGWLINLPLRLRVTASVLLLIVMIAGVLIYQIDRREQESYLADIALRLADRKYFAGAELRADIESLRLSVLFLSQTPPVQGLIRAQHRDADARQETSESEIWKRRLTAIFTAFAKTHPFYYQIRYIGIADQGRELVRVDRQHGQVIATPPERLQQKANRDYFQAVLHYRSGEVYFSKINLNREHGAIEVPHIRTVRAATPIYDTENGQLFGMIVINVDIGSFLDKLTLELPPDTRTYLMNANGDYLLHPSVARTFGFDLGRRYRWQDDYPELPLPMAGLDEMNGLRRISSSQGTLYVTTARVNFDPTQSGRLLILRYALPEAVILKQISGKRFLVSTALFGAALLISGAIFLILRRMFSPLNDLTNVARTIGDGHYDFELPAIEFGEVGAFVKAFNEMLKRIQQREAEVGQLNTELRHNEAFLNRIFETVPEAILVVNHQGRIVKSNQQTGHMFGYALDDMLGRHVEMLLPESLRGHHVGLRHDYCSNSKPRMMGQGRDLFGRRKNGSEFPIEIGMAPMWEEENQFIIVSMVDISERKRIERALRNSQEDFFRLISSNVKDYAIIMLDPEGRVLTWNEGAERIEGYLSEEIIGQSAELFYLPNDVEAGTFDQLLGMAKQNGHYEDEGWRVRKDGSKFYTDLVITAMRDPDGKLVGFTKIDHDITERRQNQEEIYRLNNELESRVQERTAELAAANRELDSFAYAVSHDLRAPLRAMFGFSRALQEDFADRIPGEANDYLDEISKASENMSELIDGLLTLSRCTRREMQRDRFDLSLLAVEISRELSHNTPIKNVDWQIESGLTAEGDIRMIKVVLRNLLGNALKYCAHTTSPQIRFYRDRWQQENLFCVADNGAGFDMAHAGRLFKPFQRLHRHDEFPGIGIGLATVQRIIHRHGGEIFAQSQPGQGAMFCFTLAHHGGTMTNHEKDTAG